MRIGAVLLVVTALVGPAYTADPAIAADIEGWQQARWGMTVTQVTAAFGADVTPVPQDKVADQSWNIAGYALSGLLWMTNQSIGGRSDIQVVFGFSATGALQRVGVTPPLDKKLSFTEAAMWFGTMESALTGKYGSPTRHSAHGHRVSNRWSLPKTEIFLTVEKSGQRGFLNLVYTAQGLGDAGKL